MRGVFRFLLAAEAIKSTALALQGIYHVHSGHSLAACVLGVCNCVPDYVLQENLQNGARLLVNEPGDALHTATASKTADCRLRDALDVVAQHLAVTLGAALAKALASLAAYPLFYKRIYCSISQTSKRSKTGRG